MSQQACQSACTLLEVGFERKIKSLKAERTSSSELDRWYTIYSDDIGLFRLRRPQHHLNPAVHKEKTDVVGLSTINETLTAGMSPLKMAASISCRLSMLR